MTASSLLHRARNSALLALLLSLGHAAGAQTVYRCGNSYSQKPCTNAVEMQLDDSRTAAQKSQADLATQRTAQEANALEKSRLAREREMAKVQAAARAHEARRLAQEAKQAREQEAKAQAQAVARKKALSRPGKSTQADKRADFKAVSPAKK